MNKSSVLFVLKNIFWTAKDLIETESAHVFDSLDELLLSSLCNVFGKGCQSRFPGHLSQCVWLVSVLALAAADTASL